MLHTSINTEHTSLRQESRNTEVIIDFGTCYERSVICKQEKQQFLPFSFPFFSLIFRGLDAFHWTHRPPLVAGGNITYTVCLKTMMTKVKLNPNEGY